jgi:hypothetical protein
MSTLTELVAQLAALVPAQSGAPSTAQYQQAVRAAVGDFGYRVPRTLYGSLAVVAGTAAYALPDGFQRLIQLEALGGETTRDAGGFLVAFDTAAALAERHVISGGTITFYPTPVYTLARALWYAAGYPYVALSDTFDGLTVATEQVVMLRAQANALRVLSSATAAGRGMSYRIGDVAVDRAVTQPHAQAAEELDAAYADACRSLVGFIGARGAPAGWEALR